MSAAEKKDEAKPVKLALNLIKADKALQPRVEMDTEHQAGMSRAYEEGEDVPPPIHVFWDGKFYWLVDGFHRYFAMWSIRHLGKKFTEIRCIVHNGTKREAIVYAAQANLDNRSKPMTDADRKKAMWMLLEDEEWRKKMPGNIGRILGVSATTSRKYWLEYFVSRELPIPTEAVSENGQSRRIVRKVRGTAKHPHVRKDKQNRMSCYIAGKTLYLGTDDSRLDQRLNEVISSHKNKLEQYESTGRVHGVFTRHAIFASSVFPQGMSSTHPGLNGLNVYGIAVSWESFRNRYDTVRAIGRAICCREMIGAKRAVVLCPVEDGPAEVLELGRKAGIEFMTIEDFVASLKGEGTAS